MHRLTVQYDAPADPAEFDARYAEHVQLCRQLPGLAGLSFSRPRPLGGPSAPYLVAQLDFEDADALKAALGSPEMTQVRADADALPAQRIMFTGEVSSD